jgi:hypothetical protein
VKVGGQTFQRTLAPIYGALHVLVEEQFWPDRDALLIIHKRNALLPVGCNGCQIAICGRLISVPIFLCIDVINFRSLGSVTGKPVGICLTVMCFVAGFYTIPSDSRLLKTHESTLKRSTACTASARDSTASSALSSPEFTSVAAKEAATGRCVHQ